MRRLGAFRAGSPFVLSRRGHDCKGDYLIRIIMSNQRPELQRCPFCEMRDSSLRLNLQKWSSYGSSCAMLRFRSCKNDLSAANLMTAFAIWGMCRHMMFAYCVRVRLQIRSFLTCMNISGRIAVARRPSRSCEHVDSIRITKTGHAHAPCSQCVADRLRNR